MISCPACGYDENPDYAEFCGACGSELNVTTATTTPSPYTPLPPVNPEPLSSPSSVTASARLIAKQPGSSVPEFVLEDNSVVGVFDPDMGPVDIDLDNFPGGDTVSRQHAEVYQYSGTWLVKDIGSTNGVFIKRAGQTRFGARITLPEILETGDEVAFGKVRFLFQSP